MTQTATRKFFPTRTSSMHTASRRRPSAGSSAGKWVRTTRSFSIRRRKRRNSAARSMLDVALDLLATLMGQAGVDPAAVYAFKKTQGLFPTGAHPLTDEEMAEWDDADPRVRRETGLDGASVADRVAGRG